MKVYVGVKVIEAKTMNLGDYNEYRGWKIPDNEDPSREGYLVQYPDGYVSWSPKEIFEEAYSEFTSHHEACIQANIVKLLISSDWKKRMHGEYLLIQDKTCKLSVMIDKYATGKLDFTPNCSVELLLQQLNLMQGYLNILKARESIEKIVE